MDPLYSPRMISALNIPIFSDGINISSNIINRICTYSKSNNGELIAKDYHKFKIALVNLLSGIGNENIHCVTIVDFIVDDKLTAVDTSFIIHNNKIDVTNTINKLNSNNIAYNNTHSYFLTEDEYYTELSFLLHIIFGPPEWIYNINYNYWTHQHWADRCKSFTFKYHKVDLSDKFVKYLNSNSFYIPDNLTPNKYILKSDSDDSHIDYSDNEISPNSADSDISLTDVEITDTIIAINNITKVFIHLFRKI